MQDALRLNGFAVCTPAAMSPWPERRRSNGAQTKNPAAHLELPDFERSGLCSDARRADCSNPMFLPIPGLNNREYVKTAIEVLRGRTLYGRKVVVAGGGMTGAETAVFLAVQGCDVTIIEMAPDIITDAVAQPRACLLEHIRKYNIKVHTHTKLTKVSEGTIYAEEYGEPVEFKHIDMLVNAMGVRSNNPLEAELKDCGCKVVVVGDASSTKNGYKNIREGFNAGNAV